MVDDAFLFALGSPGRRVAGYPLMPDLMGFGLNREFLFGNYMGCSTLKRAAVDDYLHPSNEG